MKKINSWRVFSYATLIALFSLSITGCEKDDDFDDDNIDRTYTLSGSASGSQEVPAVTTSATGSITGTYDARINTLNYTITWSGLSNVATMMHLHGPALIGAEAGPIHDLNIVTNGINGTASGTLVLADSTEAHLLNGRVYYNIHTALNPDGEIRGQVTATAN
jgi:hypothetical protein